MLSAQLGEFFMTEQYAAIYDMSDAPETDHAGGIEPKIVSHINDVDQCLEAISDLALDIGYFSDLVQAERRLGKIRQWLAREMAKYERS